FNKPLLWGIVASGPLAMLAIEFGWIYAEVGRQPWILRGYMKIAEAATHADGVAWIFAMFLALYLMLGILCVVVLIRMFKNKPAEAELEKRFPANRKEE
ncbi:cytochrome ubiquinol oxidase subunit I, partial [Rossellomorea marisflavi]